MTLLDRAEGALLGLAAADAASFPALYHREIAFPKRRRLLWTQALDGDAERVNKLPLPFTLSGDPAAMAFGPTDDAEQAALAAQVLLAGGDLFDAWWSIVEPQRDSFWGSVADISAVKNAADGLRPPHTGNDNPHFYDDSSVIRAVPIGIHFAADPARAATVARDLAIITNAEVGVDGSAAFAGAVAVLVGGGHMQEAVNFARSQIVADSWLGRKFALAERILDEAGGGPFAAVPRWTDEVGNAEYNFGNAVAETLPLALLIARSTASYAEALGVAALIPKQADTMPAMVGALLGAATGASGLPPPWTGPVEELRGVCVPSTRGVRLRDLAAALVAHATGSAASNASAGGGVRGADVGAAVPSAGPGEPGGDVAAAPSAGPGEPGGDVAAAPSAGPGEPGGDVAAVPSAGPGEPGGDAGGFRAA
ncbi:ADP-ribosylglycohydrolase family protein [Actinoplanes sp. CA-142083]|uniref:ADP-ribosylglycohydrolase family protein n=1 Tax=Actinoplanes sp. CA-142083 TaxID=3239903 RepID=UPI003D8B043D